MLLKDLTVEQQNIIRVNAQRDEIDIIRNEERYTEEQIKERVIRFDVYLDIKDIHEEDREKYSRYEEILDYTDQFDGKAWIQLRVPCAIGGNGSFDTSETYCEKIETAFNSYIQESFDYAEDGTIINPPTNSCKVAQFKNGAITGFACECTECTTKEIGALFEDAEIECELSDEDIRILLDELYIESEYDIEQQREEE